MEVKMNRPLFVSYEEGHLKIRNQQENPISFWKIDDCTFKSKDESRCDAGLWDSEMIVLVELKESKARVRRKAREKAIDQLEASL